MFRYRPSSFFLTSMDHLNQLRRLASRRGTKIEHRHTRLDVHQQRRYHTDHFLSADVAHVCFGDEKLLKGGEGREAADDILGCGHEPRQLIGKPGHWLRCLDKFAFVGDGRDLGNVEVSQTLLNCQGMPVSCQLCADGIARSYSRLRSGEAEAVGKISAEGLPEQLLVFRRGQIELVVISFKLDIMTDDISLIRPIVASTTWAKAASASAPALKRQIQDQDRSSVLTLLPPRLPMLRMIRGRASKVVMRVFRKSVRGCGKAFSEDQPGLNCSALHGTSKSTSTVIQMISCEIVKFEFL
jgi:hypothetical protein